MEKELIKIREKSKFKRFYVNKGHKGIENTYLNTFLSERNDYNVICEFGSGECTLLKLLQDKNVNSLDIHIFDNDEVVLEMANLKNIKNLHFNIANYKETKLEKSKTSLDKITPDVIICRYAFNITEEKTAIDIWTSNIEEMASKNTKIFIVPYASDAGNKLHFKQRFDNIMKEKGYSLKWIPGDCRDLDGRAAWSRDQENNEIVRIYVKTVS
tara:strand:- start:414 stop:1052 length:639 start_codon:yes stop_codon:yes gene_type:complete